MIRIGVRSFVAGSSIQPPLLDTYTSASAAYSVRLLRTAYSGNAIRVRRSSDNTEQDIGFDISGNLNESALTTFVGANNGFVTTWYDQSGNGKNATQSTAANQPQIVSSGSVIKDNNKIALSFNNTRLRFAGGSIVAVNQMSFITVSNIETNNSNTNFLLFTGQETSNNGNGITYAAGQKPTIFIWGGTESNAIAFANQNLIFATNASLQQNIWVNGANNVSKSISNININNSQITIGHQPSTSSNFFIGYIQEAIIYNTSQNTNRTGIESNINTYYGIY